MSRARTEKPYGTSYTLVIIIEEREGSSSFQNLKSGIPKDCKTKEQLSL